ncbi:UNKNOWN [Stylonychia lemnae]|uniref:Uncharacterized protein n=1 Tax=Stylonychia lemnae TaxID=5949 RepID=A0A078ATI5_STYLE|nr:UNKNOWN [Stylonychia lemnae]|eukprot:CDW85544.1 UNKNOWN [Stylonychia lemnae]
MRHISIKLKLPLNVFLDAGLFVRILVENENLTNLDKDKLILYISTTFYLSSKINEFDKVRIRDIINICYYQFNESDYVRRILQDYKENQEPKVEIEDGIWLIRTNTNGEISQAISIDYSKNQFKFMPQTNELNLIRRTEFQVKFQGYSSTELSVINWLLTEMQIQQALIYQQMAMSSKLLYLFLTIAEGKYFKGQIQIQIHKETIMEFSNSTEKIFSNMSYHTCEEPPKQVTVAKTISQKNHQ